MSYGVLHFVEQPSTSDLGCDMQVVKVGALKSVKHSGNHWRIVGFWGVQGLWVLMTPWHLKGTLLAQHSAFRWDPRVGNKPSRWSKEGPANTNPKACLRPVAPHLASCSFPGMGLARAGGSFLTPQNCRNRFYMCLSLPTPHS